MYDYTTRVGYSHTDNKKIMTIETMIDCFQDCSCFQAEHMGIGFDYLEPNGIAWILNSWQIEVKRYPHFYEKIKIATYPYDFKGFFGYRNFFIEDEKGEKIVTANSIWTLMNVEKKCPQRIPEKLLNAYEKEEKLPMEYASRKIRLPQEEACRQVYKEEPIQIKKHHLDSNQHVNNGQYIRIAAQYLPLDMEIHSLRTEYRRQALLNDEVYPMVYQKKDEFVVALCDESQSPYAVIEFQ